MKMLIPDEKVFEEKRERIVRLGARNLHILVDFDRTLTKGVINNKEVRSIMEFFRSGPYINAEYSRKSHELANFYRPYELDSNLGLDEKKKKMHEWWIKHFDLLIKSGLNKKHLVKMVNEIEKEGFLEFREGVFDFFEMTKKKNIPVIIISSSGLGEIIEMVLKKHKKFYDNIKIITNEYYWDEKGRAIGVREPIIHVFNKDETAVKDFPEIYNLIKERKNIILIGDSLGDIGMANGFDYQTLISFAFLKKK